MIGAVLVGALILLGVANLVLCVAVAVQRWPWAPCGRAQEPPAREPQKIVVSPQ